MYSYERKISGSDYYNDTNLNSFIGKVGLVYVSDYSYASSNCGNSTNSNSCNDQNWLYNIISLNSDLKEAWTITAYIASDRWGKNSSFYVYNQGIGHIQVCGAGGSKEIYPTLYLTPNVLITSGDGTESSPYIFSL